MSGKEDGMQLRVEFLYDPESHNWSFAVPALRIIGGANTREEAERRAVEAIEFALWSDAQEPPPDGGEVGYLTVTIQDEAPIGRRAL
jgi:predicted RNase H-like HicB family nuclease